MLWGKTLYPNKYTFLSQIIEKDRNILFTSATARNINEIVVLIQNSNSTQNFSLESAFL